MLLIVVAFVIVGRGWLIVVVVVVVQGVSGQVVSAVVGGVGERVQEGCGGAGLVFNALSSECVVWLHVDVSEGACVLKLLYGCTVVARATVSEGVRGTAVESVTGYVTSEGLEPQSRVRQPQEQTRAEINVMLFVGGFPCYPMFTIKPALTAV